MKTTATTMKLSSKLVHINWGVMTFEIRFGLTSYSFEISTTDITCAERCFSIYAKIRCFPLRMRHTEHKKMLAWLLTAI